MELNAELTETSNIPTVNSSWNDTDGGQRAEIYQLGTHTHAINAIISVCTILFNTVIILSSIFLKRSLPDVVRQQLFLMAFSDLIAGFSPGLWCLTASPYINTNRQACAILHAIFANSQFATLLNICLLSARRLTVLAKVSQLHGRPRTSPRVAVGLTICAWSIGLLMSIPLLLSIPSTQWVNGCFSPTMLPDPNAVLAFILVHGATLLILDVIYIISIHALKKSGRFIRQIGNNQASVRNIATVTNRTYPVVPNRAQPMFHSRFISRDVNSTIVNSSLNEGQKKAFQHLFVGLIVINITTIPFVIISVFAFVHNGLFFDNPNDILFYDFHLVAMNSLLNPIVYGIHIREVRLWIKTKILATRNALLDCFF